MRSICFLLVFLLFCHKSFTQNRIDPKPLGITTTNQVIVKTRHPSLADEMKMDGKQVKWNQIIDEIDTLYFDIDTLISKESVFIRQPYGTYAGNLGLYTRFGSAMRFNSVMDPFYRAIWFSDEGRNNRERALQLNNDHIPNLLLDQRVDDLCSFYTSAFIAQAMYLEPTLNVGNDDYFSVSEDEKTGAVFGWRYKSSFFVDKGTGVDSHRCLLRKNELFQPNKAYEVFAGAREGPIFRRIHFKKLDGSDTISTEVDTMYVTINLRSLETIQGNLLDTVLVIKVKAFWRDVSGGQIIDSGSTYIKFDQVPGTVLNSIKGTRFIDGRIEGIANEKVRITLNTLQGEEFERIYDGILPEGTHLFEIDTKELASGMYFVVVQTPNWFKAQKLIVEK